MWIYILLKLSWHCGNSGIFCVKILALYEKIDTLNLCSKCLRTNVYNPFCQIVSVEVL